VFYRQFAHGNLPDAGGLLDQAATYLDAMICVEMAMGRSQARQDEREAAAAKG
jgi:hypothetical protein